MEAVQAFRISHKKVGAAVPFPFARGSWWGWRRVDMFECCERSNMSLLGAHTFDQCRDAFLLLEEKVDIHFMTQPHSALLKIKSTAYVSMDP